MNAMEFLKKARGVDKRRKALQERIEILRAKAEKATPSYRPKIQGGVSQDRYDHIATILDLQNEFDSLTEYQNDAIKAISQLANRRQLDVMWLYYIDGYTWDEICAEFNCSRTYAWSVRAMALEGINVPVKYQNEASTKWCGYVDTVDMCKTGLNNSGE